MYRRENYRTESGLAGRKGDSPAGLETPTEKDQRSGGTRTLRRVPGETQNDQTGTFKDW